MIEKKSDYLPGVDPVAPVDAEKAKALLERAAKHFGGYGWDERPDEQLYRDICELLGMRVKMQGPDS